MARERPTASDVQQSLAELGDSEPGTTMQQRSSHQAEQSWTNQDTKLGELFMHSVRDADTHAISLSGEMDLAHAGDVEHELFRVEDGDAGLIVLDLSGLTFIDGTAIRLLYAAGRRASTRGDDGRLMVLRPPEHVHRVLRLAGVDQHLTFAD